MTDAEQLRDLAETLDSCEWNHPLGSAELCRRVADEIGRLRDRCKLAEFSVPIPFTVGEIGLAFEVTHEVLLGHDSICYTTSHERAQWIADRMNELERLRGENEQLRNGEIFDCIHCGDAIGGNDNWRSCSKHPANAEITRLRAYEQELADAASVLQSALPIGEVKAIGLREVAAGCRLLVNEVGRLRVDNEKLAKQVGEWIEHFPEAGGEE